jgi:integrase
MPLILLTTSRSRYRELCRQPWRDVVTILYGTGMRPGEAYKLRWEHILLRGQQSIIQIAEGKSPAAKRFLPMLPEVYSALNERFEAQGRPARGWVFPAGSESGHLEESSAKIAHADALKKIGAACAAYEFWKEGGSEGKWQEVVVAATKLEADYVERQADVISAGLKPFEPYCLRHSALTRLAERGCDAFTLARIAGHSSITITQRYCHPQADAIERAFAALGPTKKLGS